MFSSAIRSVAPALTLAAAMADGNGATFGCLIPSHECLVSHSCYHTAAGGVCCRYCCRPGILALRRDLVIVSIPSLPHEYFSSSVPFAARIRGYMAGVPPPSSLRTAHAFILSQEELIQLASNCEYKRYVFYGRFRQSFFAHLRDGGRSHDAFWWILDNQRLHVSPLSREVVRHEPRAYRSVDDLVVYLHFYFICRTW